MKCFLNGSNDPYFNLAFEEYCLGNLPCDDTFFILWQNAPAVIIGKNQDVFQEVDCGYAHDHGIKLVRRITGGGAVYHDLGNLNISIMGNYKLHPDYAHEYGEWICGVLRNIGLKSVEMNGRNDLYVDGRKISGWAKRIQNDSFLLHGTLLYDVDLEQLVRVLHTKDSKMHKKAAVQSVRSVVQNVRELLDFENVDELKVALGMEMQAKDECMQLTAGDLEVIDELVSAKYKTDSWIYNLSFEPTLSKGFSTCCGFITVNVLLKENKIEALQFKGDFLGNKDTEELCRLLHGVEWNKPALEEALNVLHVDDYFTGLSNEQFLSLIYQ